MFDPLRLVPAAVRGFFIMPGSRPWLVLSCLGLASLVEGFGLATLLPVLAIATGETVTSSPLGAKVAGLLASLGLNASLGTLAALIALAMVLKALLMVGLYRVVAATAAGVTAELRRQLVAGLLQARWPYLLREPSGRLANAIGVEALRCGDGYVVAANVFVFAIQSLVYLAVAFLVSPGIAALALLAGGGVALLLRGFIRRARRTSRKTTRHSAAMSMLVADTLANIKPIKAMGRESGFLAWIEHNIRMVQRALRRQTADRETLASLQEAVIAVLLACGFWLAHRFAQISAAELLVSGLLLARSAAAINKVQKAFQAATQYLASWEHLQALIRSTTAMAEPAGGRPPPPLLQGIRFERVSFAYEATPVLRELELELRAGEITVITGPSGVGKTTLVDLLLALLEPTSGRIVVDGVPLSELDRQQWRRMIGYVPQDPPLLHASVRDNLTLGDTAIDETAIGQALALAEATFVAELPQGLATVVGERGARLSGGERQRLALARALVHRPRLLILDEVTSALDAETEQRVCGNLRHMPNRPTILAVTHRPAWLAIADQVVEWSGQGWTMVRAQEPRAEPLPAAEA